MPRIHGILEAHAPWEMYRDLFAPCILETDDDVVRPQKDETKRLKEEWFRYCQIERHSFECSDDVAAFCQDRGSILSAAVMPYLWCPVAAVAIERCLSLAGLIDTKTQQNIAQELCTVLEQCFAMEMLRGS